MKTMLFFAEKPSAMRLIQESYNNSDKPLGNIDFIALAGHVCRLCEPKDYEKWNVKWGERELPMIPSEFKVDKLKGNENIILKIKNKLKSNKYDGIIVGTDSDVEGNGIYDLLETYIPELKQYNTYRFFESDLTPAGIMRSMNNLSDYRTNPRDVGMTEAYRIRSRFDWLIGFNMSVAYTVKSGFLMKVGRVKAPTLKLVYDNCKAIDSFTSKTAYQPEITTAEKELTALLIDEDGKPKAFSEKSDAETIIDNLSGIATVKFFEKNIKQTPAPSLYKLTDIQYEAGLKFGYTPEKTLELIQSLYETHRLISYPRTDGRYVSSEKAKDFPRLLKAVESIPKFKDIVSGLNDEDINKAQTNPRYVNDKKVQESSHDALIPTGETRALSKISEDEKNICEMIFSRFLAIFLPVLEEEKTKAILEDNGYLFACTGSKVIHPGHTILGNIPKDSHLPDLTEGEILTESRKSLHEVINKPPQRFTQATLIKAMEGIQKYVAEGDLKNAIKKAGGIGQPSSRAAIISELVSAEYVKDITSGKNKGLHMTDKGKKYIENLGNSSISNPKLSAEWEMHMNDIREGIKTYDEVYQMILDYLQEVLNELKNMDIQKYQKERREVGTCSICGKPIVELKKAYGCSGYPNCKFIIPKSIAGKKLTSKNVKDLIGTGKTGLISGFKSKSNKTFDAGLKIENGQVVWDSCEEKTTCKCPKCGKTVIATPMLYRCEDEKCGFKLGRTICSKKLTDKQIESLINNRKTELIKGFKSLKTGNTFDAKLVINDDGSLGFEFESTRKK